MPSDPPEDVLIILDRLRTILGRHEGIREAISVLGRALTAFAEWSKAPSEEVPAEPPAGVESPAAPAAPAAAEAMPAAPVPPPVPAPPPIPIRAMPPLTFRSAAYPIAQSTIPDGDRELELVPLRIVAERCRAKADACRIVANRLANPTDAWDHVSEIKIITTANGLPDCNLWMLNRDPVNPIPKVWLDLAGAFATAADAAMMLNDWLQAPGPIADQYAARLLGLGAEAQSVLLYAVAEVRDVKVDFDQVQMFAHIRTVAREREVFIPKYLKREDRVDPASWPDVARRVAEMATVFRAFGERDKTQRKVFKSLQHKAKKLLDDPIGSSGEWPRVIELVDQLVATGLPPSNIELRDILLPVVELLPDELELTPNVTLVVREIDRYLTPRAKVADNTPEQPSAELAAAASLLRGKEAVMIGGLVRPEAKAALMRALGLSELHWESTDDHESLDMFEAPISRPGVAVVLLAIRWSSHSYGEVQEYCQRYGKVLVRLPGGYNPNQVAHQIMAQVGDRLRSTG